MAVVLVIDDEPDIRELVRLNLGLAGHDVLTAADGAEGLDVIDVELPDVVILDVMMPGQDGWTVLSTIKGSRPEVAEIPVVMLTARADDIDRIRGGIEGALHYLTKPFSLAELRDQVAAVLAGASEPVQRRKVQQAALEQLARLEKRGEGAVDDDGPRAARPRMTRLGRIGDAAPTRAPDPAVSATLLGQLSEKQRELIDAVARTPTVSEAAEQLAVSRSNVYASLRRIARKLDVRTVSELVLLARAGALKAR